MPPVTFTTEQAARLAALAFVALLANFCGGLLTQNGDAVTDTFRQNDQALGLALAVARIGVLVSLVVIALADRLGRRKLILFSLAGACIANAIAGLAPSFEVFTGAQLFTRAFVNACLVVAGIAAVEEAPEGARAFATAMFALALGVGIALGVIFLPFADLGNYGWRISFLVSAGALFFLPFVGRQLRETRRYTTLVGQSVRRGRLREVFASTYRARFLLLGLVAFVTNVFIAPSSQLTNRYLTRAHDFSNSDVAGFRTVTAGLPGLVGVLLAGRLTESRGRRPGRDRRPPRRDRVPDGLLRRERRRTPVGCADDRHRRRGMRRARARHPRRRALPHGDTRDVEWFPAGRGRRRVRDRAARRDAATRRDGWTRPRDCGVRDPDADRGGAPRAAAPRNGVRGVSTT